MVQHYLQSGEAGQDTSIIWTRQDLQITEEKYGTLMRKMMKKAIALSLIATMSMSAATIVHAEDEVTLRVLNWGNTDEEKIAMMPLLVYVEIQM